VLPEDLDLVERAKRGDTEAYGALVRRYQALAVRAAGVVDDDLAEAEDAAQEAFVKAYYSLGSLRDAASFRPWLLRIVVNEARNRRKATERRTARAERASEPVGLAAGAESPEAAALAAEQRRTLWNAVGALREDDRMVIAYRYFFDLSEGEMAEALRCAPGTVKSRLSRALARLRERLHELAGRELVRPARGDG
jgi:RNA polymerase sigma factor (sigma-70 family)